MPPNQYIAKQKKKTKTKKVLILTVITNIITKNDKLFRKSF